MTDHGCQGGRLEERTERHGPVEFVHVIYHPRFSWRATCVQAMLCAPSSKLWIETRTEALRVPPV